MLELGPDELRFHREVGEECGGLAWVLCFGPRSSALADGARSAGVAAVGVAGDVDDGMKFVHAQLRAGDAVLLKASRGMKLERFAHALGAAERGGH
jgi:UDP-N-acetylmuramoyl-tripeptide--D-alanyl-D-alanine ligase